MIHNPLEELIQRYGPAAGPYGVELMAKELFDVELDEWQRNVSRDYCSGTRRISIAACHGPGKTFVVSLWVVRQMLCLFPQKAVATAPSKNQLENALVGEIVSRFRELPPQLQDLFEIKKNRIELRAAPEKSFFTASTARAESPEAIQGIHSDHVLLIVDEASGVPEAIFASGHGSMSGHNATTVLLSNPTRGSGYFFDTFHKGRSFWKTYRISAFDSPRVTQDYVDETAQLYGEDSNVYRVRVLGQFPAADDDTIIPLELVESAMQRDIFVPKDLGRVWGLDVARFGDDRNALVVRDNLSVHPDIEEWSNVDLMATVGRVKRKWDETPTHERPSVILVDAIGLGAGVADRLMELGLPARAIQVSEKALDQKYDRLRSELWFLAREWLDARNVVLPTCPGGCPDKCLHQKLAGELTSPKYKYSSNGRLAAEPKDAMKKRGIKSPNVAEAFILTFAEAPATMMLGADKGWGGYGWNQPVNLGRVIV